MDTNRVTVRYAKAFVELASEEDVLMECYHDISVLYYSLTNYQGFRDSLVGQKMMADEKLGRLNEMFADSFQPLTLRFIQLIVTNYRYQYLPDICRNCLDMIRRKEQISTGKIVFAQPVGQKLVDELKEKFQKKTQRNIELSSETDPSLIGGFIFTIDGMQYDASIATRLATIKKQLQIK